MTATRASNGEGPGTGVSARRPDAAPSAGAGNVAAATPGSVRAGNALTLVLAALAALLLATGGVRWKIAGIVVSVGHRSADRLAMAAGLVAFVRFLAWGRERWTSRGNRGIAVSRWHARLAARRSVLAVLGACILFYLVNNTCWLALDASSPSFDRAAHARFALRFLRMFQDPLHLSLRALLNVTQYWPPFFHLCSVPVTMLLGFSVQHMAATNFLFLFVAVYGIYHVGERLFDAWVGAGAVVLTLLYPIVYALSRDVLVDFALIAMVMLSLHCILATDAGLGRRGAWLGAVVGCAMLTKWTAVTFLAGPALVWLVVCARRLRPSLRAAAASLSMAALVAAIVAVPWYVNSMTAFLKGATVAFGSDPAREGDPSQVLASLQWYWRAVGEALIMKPLLLPTLFGLAAFAVRVRSWTRWAFLLSSIVPAMTFFVLIPNKDARFVAPLLPLVAIMTAAGLRRVPWAPVRVAAWAVVVVAGLYQFYAISFGWPAPVANFYTHAPDRRDWKVHEIVTALASIDSPHPLRVAVLPEDPNFEPNLFQLDVLVRSLPLEVDGFGQSVVPVRALRPYDVLISKTGIIAVEYTAKPRLQFRDALGEWIAKGNRAPEVTLWRTWPLPDGSIAEAYRVR